MIDRQIGQLEPYAQEAVGSVARWPECRFVSVAGGSRIVYEGKGWVGNFMHPIATYFDGMAHEIRIDGIGVFSISGNGREIKLLAKASDCSDTALIEAVLGPVLIFALAIGDVFCIHASAVEMDENVILFTGESGSGKSTMAKLLQDTGAGRMTDDISPLLYNDYRFMLLTDFPQMKLSADEQNEECKPEKLAVESIYCLNRSDSCEHGTGQIVRSRLTPVDSFSRLTAQCVASRLFNDDLLRAHVRWTAKLAELVPVYELTYPSGAEHYDAIREFLLGARR